MKGNKHLFKRLWAAVLALVMVLTYVVVDDGTTSYAKAAKTTTVDAVSISYKINYAYEGQKFSETTFRKNAAVKVKKNGKISTVKNYTVSAPSYVKANGTGKNKGKFTVRVTYGGKSTYKVFTIRKINKIYVKSSSVKMLENGATFNATSFKKKTVVYAKYKVGKGYKYLKLPTYTVSASKTVSANAKAKKYKGYFYVNIKYGNHTTTRYIPVIKGIKATSSLKTLNEGEKFDAAAFRKSVTATRIFANGKTERLPASGFKLVSYPSTVRSNSKTHPDSVGVKIQSGTKAAYAYVKINPLSRIGVTSNKTTALNEGTTFSEKDFRSKIVVRAYYKASSADKNITGYTVSVPSKTVKPDKNGKYVVTITFAGKRTTVAIPVETASKPTSQATVSKITVSSNIPYLYNGIEVDDALKATIENSLTVKAVMSDGSTKTLNSSSYKVRTVTRVVVYTGESSGFRVDVDYSSDITGKCYIPVITGIVVHPKDTSASFELTKGASYTKEDFLKLFDVFDIYGDQHEEACKKYEFIAPKTVYSNGEGEDAGAFVVKVTSNSGNFEYSVSYNIVDSGTVNPDSTPNDGQEVDWLTFYGEKYSAIPDDPYYWVSIFAEKNEPSDCGTLKDCGIVVSFGDKANPKPTIEICDRNYCQTNTNYSGWSQTFNLDSSNSVTDDSIIYVRVYAETTDGNVYYSKVLSFRLGGE